MADKAKYYCENCGAEVAANARFCRKCGRFFSSVRCPQCGFTGSARSFKDGCPQCHYAMPSSEVYGTASPDEEKRELSSESKKKIRRAFASQKKNERKSQPDDALPRWVYVLSLAVLAAVVVVLVMRCRS